MTNPTFGDLVTGHHLFQATLDGSMFWHVNHMSCLAVAHEGVFLLSYTPLCCFFVDCVNSQATRWGSSQDLSCSSCAVTWCHSVVGQCAVDTFASNINEHSNRHLPPFSKPKHTSPQLLKSWIFPSYLGSCYQATAFIYTLQHKKHNWEPEKECCCTSSNLLGPLADFGCNTGRQLIVRPQLIWIWKLHVVFATVFFYIIYAFLNLAVLLFIIRYTKINFPPV